jgi:hypothetical protein
MSRVRIGLAAVALLAAVFAALLAADLRSWADGIRNGDTQYAESPASAAWSTPTVLPFHLARGILGISDQIAFRQAAQSFVPVHVLGNGFDNGYSESRARADLELVLAGLSRGRDRARAATADNMLGILAYADTQATGSAQPAPVDRAVADFQAAVQLDPANTDAKFNLEWLQRQLVVHGTRSGNASSAGGAKRGRKGAGGGTPGRGY